MLNLVKKTMQSFIEDESGQDLIEYALLGGMVVGAGVTAFGGLATGITTRMTAIVTALSAASI